MLLIPAIDLKDGHCVRLKQGDMDQSTTFGEDPAAMARKWVDAGARRLHLVDLNGAFAGVPDNSYFYFVHSFYAVPRDAAHCAGQADYGGWFAAAIARDNIFATQFHPEKSAEHGLALYRNFLHWNP